MKYLDYSKLPEFLRTHFGASASRRERLVGRKRLYDSGYYDIIRFFGTGAVDPATIRINYLPGLFSFSDPLIAEFSAAAEKRLREENRLYRGPTVMKLAGLDLQAQPPTMTVQECRYGDQAGSCFALDLPHPLFEKTGGTLREYFRQRYPSTDIAQNPLAVCLGVCGYVVVREPEGDFLLQIRRSAQLASLESSLGPSVAGAVDYVTGYENLAELTARSLSMETSEELGLPAEDYSMVPLALAREIFRGERPQLFCLIQTRLSQSYIAARLNAVADGCEFDRFEFVRFDPAREPEPDWLDSLNHEARMNYYLLEEYWADR